jgi:hypothetical protein
MASTTAAELDAMRLTKLIASLSAMLIAPLSAELIAPLSAMLIAPLSAELIAPLSELIAMISDKLAKFKAALLDKLYELTPALSAERPKRSKLHKLHKLAELIAMLLTKLNELTPALSAKRPNLAELIAMLLTKLDEFSDKHDEFSDKHDEFSYKHDKLATLIAALCAECTEIAYIRSMLVTGRFVKNCDDIPDSTLICIYAYFIMNPDNVSGKRAYLGKYAIDE